MVRTGLHSLSASCPAAVSAGQAKLARLSERQLPGCRAGRHWRETHKRDMTHLRMHSAVQVQSPLPAFCHGAWRKLLDCTRNRATVPGHGLPTQASTGLRIVRNCSWLHFPSPATRLCVCGHMHYSHAWQTHPAEAIATSPTTHAIAPLCTSQPWTWLHRLPTGSAGHGQGARTPLH
jgi:hypothetical protein